MRMTLIPVFATLLASASFGMAAAEPAPDTPPSEAEQQATDEKAIADFSRVVGMAMAGQAQTMGLETEQVVAGFTAVLNDGASPPDQQTMMAMQAAFQAARNRPLEKISKKVIESTDIESSGTDWKAAKKLPASVHDEFYQAFVARDDVKTTESGLAYQVIVPGPEDGAHPGPTDQVTVHYVGRHTNGEVFDSSVGRGEPTSFGLDQVITGWTEGLQLMPVGATYRFVIPGELAYGPLKEGSQRPTGVLIFDVTLLRIG